MKMNDAPSMVTALAKARGPRLMLLALSTLALPAVSQMPTAVKGYTVTVFAQGVTGQYTKPDSIAVLGNHVFIGYGDGNDPGGLDGKSNQIVQYSLDGKVEWIYTVKGHNDGLKVNRYTHLLWSMQNEDTDPNLVVIDPETHDQTLYTFAAAPAAGGGYDDITFRNGKAYFSASNPTPGANNLFTNPAIVEATISGTTISVTPTLMGDATATDVVTGSSVTLNLSDPDSMTLTPSNDILLDSQGDSELILVHNPGGANQTNTQIPLSSPFGTPQADDTLFVPASEGFILVSDTPANITYKISKKRFVPGTAFTAADGAADANGNFVGFVGALDMNFGDLRPVVTGLMDPHGLGFVPARGDEGEGNGGSCPAN
jgi:hypothetical protein